MASLSSDIVGRVKRLPLKPTAASALMPLFEAVSNSLHAVQDLYGQKVAEKGEIEIQAHRYTGGISKGQISGFTIKDNGIGLTEENFKSFLRPDSQYKIKRGGKGIGRLGWLKIFKDIGVDSHFKNRDKLARRSFKFLLQDEDQVQLDDKAQVTWAASGTQIKLTDYDSSYGSRCPTRWETIAERLVGHFLPVFAAESAPFISYLDGDEYLDLREYFSEQIVEQDIQTVQVELGSEEKVELTLHHMKAKKAIRADKSKWNWLFLSANERAVEEAPLDETLGLKALDGEFVYLGCASGEYLDSHVNQERTGFSFSPDENILVRRALAKSAREFLATQISEMLANKKFTTTSVVSENPQFLYIQGELTEFVEKLPANANSKEDILVELSRHRFRRQREFRGIEKEIHESADYTTSVAEKVEEYKKFMQGEQAGSLAEYVLKRKSVLDLLDKFLGYDDSEKKKHHLEEAVHKLICPMRVDSASVDIADHNLWIADDRLAFFNFFASDKQFKQYTTQDSLERPDLAFFYDTCFAWRESATPNTVVLIEFKRPGREDYSSEEGPLDQVLGYVERFKTSTSLKDSKGAVLSANTRNAGFHCYIIADLTDGLRKKLRGHGEPTPDGEGLFGYTSNPKVYFEVVPYSKLLRDAKARNAIFFQMLGLNDHGQITQIV